MEKSVPIQLVLTNFYFLLKLSKSGTVNKRKIKGKIETMTRRRIKSESTVSNL